jgi:hypothetical protein
LNRETEHARDRLFRRQALEQLRGPLAADEPVTLAPARRGLLWMGLALALACAGLGWIANVNSATLFFDRPQDTHGSTTSSV